MLNLKNKLAKRILAFVLSGAMVVSGMSTSGITAYASQSSEDTGGYYEEMVDNTEKKEDDADEKDAGKGSSGKTTSDNKQSSETKSSLSAENKEEKKISDADNKSENIDKAEHESEENEEDVSEDKDSEKDDADEKEQAEVDQDNKAASSTVWDFQYERYQINGGDAQDMTLGEHTSGTYYGGLVVSLAESNGVFSLRGNDVEISPGTSVKIPLTGKSTVTIFNNSGYNNFTLDGVAPSDATKTGATNTDAFVCAGTGGYAVLEVPTKTSYICSITVTPFEKVSVSGTVEGLSSDDLSEAKLVFTDNEFTDVDTYEPLEVSISSGTYSTELYDNSSYAISVKGIEGYEVSGGGNLKLSGTSTEVTHDVTLSTVVKRVELKGNITVPDDSKLLNSLKITFNEANDSGNSVEAEIKNDKTYTAQLKANVAYTIEAEADYINDYELDTDKLSSSIYTDNKITINADTTQNITFNALDTYPVTLDISGTDVMGDDITEGILKTAGAELVFTREKKADGSTENEGYVYTFTVGNDIKLRNGTYNVKTANSAYITDKAKNAYEGLDTDKSAYIATSDIPDLVISENGENNLAVTYKYASTWDFTSSEFQGLDIRSGQNVIYNGLYIEYAEKNSSKLYVYSYPSYTHILVPVKGACRITLNTDGSIAYPININGKSFEESAKTYTYDYNGGEGAVKIYVDNKTDHKGGLFNDISVTYAKKINIAAAEDITNGTVTAKTKTTAFSGETVKLSDVAEEEADTDYGFDKWVVTYEDENGVKQTVNVAGDSSSGYSFIMPDANVTISAVFKTLGATHSIGIAAATAIENGSATQVTGEGSITTAKAGESVDLDKVATATPAEKYTLSYWEISYTDENEPKTEKIYANAGSGKYMFEMPDSDVIVKPVFAKLYNINVETGNVTNGTIALVTDAVTTAPAGKTVLLSAVATEEADSGYEFKGWTVTDTEDDTKKVTVTEFTTDDGEVDYKFTMPNHNVIISAVFEKIVPKYVAAGKHDFTTTNAGLDDYEGISFDGFTGYEADTAGHGFKFGDNATITLNLSGKANVKVLSCCFGSGTAVTMEDSKGNVIPPKEVDEFGKKGNEFTVTGATAGALTLTFRGSCWIHSITVTYDKVIDPNQTKKIDVWDFGAKAETNTDLYNNNITAAELAGKITMYTDDKGNSYPVLTDGTVFNFGDDGDGVTIKTGTRDRIYADSNTVTVEGITFASLTTAAKNAYDDGYTAAGGWYCNGKRSASTGYVKLNKVQAGDVIVAYMGIYQNGPTEFTFAYQGSDGAQSETVSTAAFEKFTFAAKYDGAYMIYQSDGGDGKPMYHRIMRIPTVIVSGKINTGDTGISRYGLTFINKTDSSLPNIVADVDENGNYIAELSAGYQYKALLTGSGTSGYGIKFTDNADKVTTAIENVANGIKKNFDVAPQTTYTYSGTIEGFASNYERINDLKITLMPTSDFDVNEEDLTINSDMTFTAALQPNAVYTLGMEGVNDYEVTAPSQICIENNADLTNQTITVALKPMYDVIGGFIGLGDGVTVNSLKFTNVEDNYEYTASVANGGYSVSLRDGEYLASAVASDDKYSTKTHVIVDGGMVSQDLYFVAPEDTRAIPYVSDIYVGYPKQTSNYKTVNEAVKAASRMTRTGNQRVTIHIAPGTYREQIIVNTPYISFVNDTDDEVLLTWYYGIGYVYYSAGTNGYYDAEKAYDKYTKNGVDRWGCAVRINANYFQAKNITFENSFNRYITDEEIEDGAEPAVSYGSTYYTDTSINVARNYTTDVTSRAATERAAAIAIDTNANYAEFYQCSFLSSQDTVYTSKTAYFKNCLLEGMTDYLFGDGDIVFDNCELSWKGYSESEQGGYITAVQGNTDHGYLFRNCTVTANGSLKVGSGYFGRPWRQAAKVAFVNTKLATADLISAKGWTDMSGATAAGADFKEYNTTTLDGSEITYSSPRSDKKVNDNPVSDVTKYFNGWTPEYYTPDATGTVTFSADPSLTDNGDINVPNPGHTLTVEYSLGEADDENDASTIKWFIVDDVNGTNPKLEKFSTASVDKTYKITKAASEKYIMVEVTPETVDGRTGEAKSFILKTVIGKDYVDPSSGSSITVGDGINVYLAGDSTVNDYSAKGMWNNGKQSEDLGSWGEYLQSFFNEKEVTVQNFARGGRSSRSFMNEADKYGAIEKIIGEGDYLFIQFGHNDSSIDENKKDVYTPIGAKGSDGKYPYTPGEKVNGKYPDYYTYSGGEINWNGEGTATYCWFLQQYVDMALAKGAIPVIMSPVARMQYSSTGNKTHHADEHNTSSYYWEAARQVYEDNKDKGVLFIDAYGLTTELFNGAYADGGEPRGKEIMSIKDGTHNNKLGGMVEAMLVAEAIQNLNTTLSYTVKTPAQVGGVTTTGKTVFSINASGKFTAYEQKFTGNKDTAAYTDDTFTTKSDYWTNYGNNKLAVIGKKAGELEDSNVSDKVVAAPKAASVMSDDADGNTTVTVTLSCATEGATIYYTDDGTNPKASDGKTPAAGAKEYDDSKKIVLTEDTVIKAFAMAKDMTASKVVTFEISATPDMEAPTANVETGSTIASGTVIELETTTSGAQIRYTMGNGSKVSDPTIYSPLYDKEKGLTITNSTTIKAIAVKNGVASAVATFTYIVDSTLKATVANPTANIASGETVALKETISLKSATKNAKIYYTTDGTVPTTSSTPYEGAITVTENLINNDGKVVIKAIAVKENMDDSEVVTFTYTVDKTMELRAAKPEADPPTDSKVKVGDTVKLSSSTAGAKIVYTTDGKDPVETSESAAPSPVTFTITESMVSNNKVTIKAIATSDDPDRKASEVVTITYKVESGSQNPPSGNESDDNTVEEDEKLKADEGEKNQEVSLSDESKITVMATDLVATKKQQWKVTVTYKHKVGDKTVEQELTEGVHYYVILTSGNGISGDQKIVVKGTENITDLGKFIGTSKEVSYKLIAKTEADKDKDISKLVKGLNIVKGETDTYSREYKVPTIAWKEGKEPVKDTDGKDQYAVVYKNNVNVGKASVTVIGQGEYYGTKTLTFSIKAAKINTASIESDNLKVELNDKKKYEVTAKDNDALIYAGEPIVFENLVVTLGGKTLKRGLDYTITYKNNAKVGKAAATIKAMNNYSGSIALNYVITAPELSAGDLENLKADAEYAKKGPQVLEIEAGGVTLKAGTDFKVDYSNIKNDIKTPNTTVPGYTNKVTITGVGAYKPTVVKATGEKKGIQKGTEVTITVVKGKFHIKSGVTVDAAAVEKAGTDVKKLIAATKITDAAGTKPTDKEIAGIKTTPTTVEIVLTEDAKANYDVDDDISCHVAKKLSSVVKQKAASRDKNEKDLNRRQEKYFDGVNKVELTKDDIFNYYLDSKVRGTEFKNIDFNTDYFKIVSYKNNHKVGSATVTIEGMDDSPYYGTINLKFKIVTVAKPGLTDGRPENPDDESSSSEESSDTDTSTEPNTGEDDKDTSVKATIWVVGDSTVSAFKDKYYIPRQGYGEQIATYFNADVYNFSPFRRVI